MPDSLKSCSTSLNENNKHVTQVDAKISLVHEKCAAWVRWDVRESQQPLTVTTLHSSSTYFPTPKMTTSTLLIEGSFPELAEEFAQYLDNLSEGAGIFASIEGDLNSIREAESQETPEEQSIQKSKDDVLKKIITKATILNGAPDRGMKTQSSAVSGLT